MKTSSGWMGSVRRLVLCAGALVAGAASAQDGSDNPMAFVGEQHNGMLACLVVEHTDAKVSPFETLVTRCGFKAGMPTEEFVATYSPYIPKDMLAPMTEQMRPYRAYFNDKQYGFIEQMERILSTQEPREAAVSLARLEKEAVATLGRDRSDLAVLAGLSTARSSTCIWGDGGCTPTWPWPWPRPKPRWPEAAMQARIPWWVVASVDAVGAMVGGILAGPGGAVAMGATCSLVVSKI